MSKRRVKNVRKKKNKDLILENKECSLPRSTQILGCHCSLGESNPLLHILPLSSARILSEHRASLAMRAILTESMLFHVSFIT